MHHNNRNKSSSSVSSGDNQAYLLKKQTVFHMYFITGSRPFIIIILINVLKVELFYKIEIQFLL